MLREIYGRRIWKQQQFPRRVAIYNLWMAHTHTMHSSGRPAAKCALCERERQVGTPSHPCARSDGTARTQRTRNVHALCTHTHPTACYCCCRQLKLISSLKSINVLESAFAFWASRIPTPICTLQLMVLSWFVWHFELHPFKRTRHIVSTRFVSSILMCVHRNSNFDAFRCQRDTFWFHRGLLNLHKQRVNLHVLCDVWFLI
jgi:hypothetical protein